MGPGDYREWVNNKKDPTFKLLKHYAFHLRQGIVAIPLDDDVENVLPHVAFIANTIPKSQRTAERQPNMEILVKDPFIIVRAIATIRPSHELILCHGIANLRHIFKQQRSKKASNSEADFTKPAKLSKRALLVNRALDRRPKKLIVKKKSKRRRRRRLT